jgi:uracil permease
MIRLIPFVIGILAGYAVASIFTLIGGIADIDTLKVINFAYITDLFKDGITINTFFTIPKFTFIEAFKGVSEFNGTYFATIAVAYMPVAFVVFAEHIADHKNISSIIEKDLLEDPGLHRTLLGDGVGSMAGAFFGGCPNTTYGESVGCVAITGNASIVTILAAAIGAIAISFLAPFVAFVNTIPSCVMGGVCMALYGFIAVSGLKMIKNVDLEQNANLFTVSVILIAGIGGLSLSFGKVTITSIACALILGILVNLLVNKARKNADK